MTFWLGIYIGGAIGFALGFFVAGAFREGGDR